MATADSRLTKLREHVDGLIANPQLPIDAVFFEECEMLLAPFLLNSHDRLLEIVVRLARLLSIVSTPEPVIRLLSKLAPGLTWPGITLLDPPVDFTAGLNVDALPYNHLTLDLLSKAAEQAKDVAALASTPALVRALVLLSLLSPDTGVARKAADTIISFLSVDMEDGVVTRHGVGAGLSLQPGQGQGLLWRRVFDDQDVYRTFFIVPSLKDTTMGGKREKTLAQGRLLELVSRMSVLDWDYLTRSHHPSIESVYGLQSGESLLDFAFVHVIDFKSDILMHMTLIQACAELLKTNSTSRTSPGKPGKSTAAQQYLKSKGLHQRSIFYWLPVDVTKEDPFEVSFLYGYSAEYLSAYMSLYPDDFLQDTSLVNRVLEKLSRALDLSSFKWLHSGPPLKHDLSVLASLPAVALLPQTRLGRGTESSPLLRVPCSATNAEALHALGHIFWGPKNQPEELDSNDGLMEVDKSVSADRELLQAGARAAFITYFHHHPTLFTDLTAHADTVALIEKAIPAINVLNEILGAQWAPLPEEGSFNEMTGPACLQDLPSDAQLQALLPKVAGFPDKFPLTGLDLILNLPPQQDIVGWIMTPPKKFSNLVGGSGDAETAAYKVGAAKWTLIQNFYVLIKAANEKQSTSQLVNLFGLLQSRFRDGMWGTDFEIGGRIATIGL